MCAEKCNRELTLRWDYLKWLCNMGGSLIHIVREMSDVVSRLGQLILVNCDHLVGLNANRTRDTQHATS
jgi:hypothetical protein